MFNSLEPDVRPGDSDAPLTKASKRRLREIGPVEVTKLHYPTKLFRKPLPNLPRSFEQGVLEVNEILCRGGDHLFHLSDPGW